MSNSQTVSPLQTLEMFKESHPDLNSIEKILNFTEENFITTYLDREPFNGDVRKARRTYREALRIQEQITLLWANIKDTIASPSIKEALFNNIPDSFLEFQNLIPAYNRIFGNLDFIECEHTRSIFGPAAYFVDLLRFIEKHIPQDQVEHPLAERQPRLFNLALDKENTFNLVPYIDLVNEVLEDFVRKGDSSPYQELEKAKFPIDLPFHLPLEEIRIYLKQLKIKLQDIYRLFSLVGDNAFANLKNTNIDEEKSKQIYQELQKNNILDFRGAITDAFQPDKAGYSLKLSNDFDQDDEKAVIKKLKEYKAIEPEIAREILALSPREYKLLAKEISDDQIFAYYGSKELFTISKTNFSAAIETALNNSSTNLVEVLDRPANNSFKEELKEKKFDLSGKVEVLVISPNEKWQLFIPEKNARYTIDKQDASLTFYREVSLKGKGSLEDVEKFIEQTKLTHKQLNELLYLDLSNDEINANLNSLFFINNTGDGKGSLRIEHDCENELFRTIASFYTELENREFSAELRTKFTENGIGTLSENVKVLVDVLLAKKSDKWLLKDIENNKEYILQKDSSDLIVFEGNVEKFKVENVAESVITGLNKSEFPALLKDKFAEHNIAISEKIKISKWQTEKWRIWDSDNDKTYIVRHDKNELIVSDEPYDCIQNLTPQKLDRIYRFLKLARKLDWSYADLDWALRSLQDTPTGERVLNFDGVNDYVAITDIPSAQNPFTPDLTLEAWVQPALAGNNPIFTAGSPDGGFTQFQFFITPLGKLAFFCNAQDARGDRNWESELKSSQINSGNSDSKIYFAQPKQGGELVAIDLQAIPGKAPNNEQHGLILLSDRSISLGTFSHVAVTIQEAYKIEASDTNTFSQLKFYINGTLDTTWTVLWKGNSPALDVTAIQSDITTIEINIGKDLLSEFFSGSITDVRLWKSVRTAEDIKDNRFKRLTGRDVNLISYWPMVTSSELQIQWPLSENPELQVYDLANSTPKLHGILGGSNLYLTPVWINGDLILEPFPAPISIYAYNFNGIDQYVGGTVTNLDSLEKFTFEAIVSIAEAGTHPVISLGKLENNQIELQHQLWIDPSNKLVLVTVTDGTNQFKFTSNNVITINQSTHITVVFNGTDAEFYIDGQQSTTTNETTTITPIDLEFADSTLLYLGRNFDNNPNTAYLKGTLQEVRIWNSERSTDQIEETRHYQLDGSEENLAGYWRLNEPNPQLANSSEAATRDRSFNGNHLFPGGIPKLYHPTDKPYDEVILPQPVAENAQNLHFWAQQYNIKIENKQRHGLGHSEQFTLQFWFKADEPIITDRKQLLFTQGDEDNGLSIYLNGGKVNLYAWAASLELAGTPQEYVRTIKSEILFSQALTDLDWHHLTFTYDETAELEIFSVNESYEKLNDREIQQGSVLESELKSQANLSDTYEVLVDIINQQWRIRDLLQRKTFLVRRSDERLTVYEKTPQDEIAFRFYLDGQAISEVTSTGYNNKDNGFRLDQVGDIYLGNLNTISFDELIFTRFDDGPATDDSYFKGQISDFRLWAIAIPQEYIETPAHEKHRRHISPVSEEHLLCYLPMTEGFGRSVSDHQGPLYSDIDLGQGAGYGPQILDQSPHRHHGKLSVGSDDVEQKWHTVTDLPVFRDRVLQLNGQDRYLLLPCAEELKLVKQSFTIEVWVKVAAFSPDMPIIGSISPSQQVPNQDFYLLLSDEGQIIAGFNDGDITTSEKLSLDTWHHIAWSFERETGLQKLYIDGKFQKIQDSGETCRGLEKDIPLYLGLRRQEPSNDGDPLIDKFFHGEIAELRIWQSTRTEEQIEKWWNVIPNEKDATPEAYWVFNRDPRSVLLDRTEHHRRAMVEIDPSGDIDQKWVQEHVPLRRQALTVQLNENPPEPIEYIDLANYQIGQQGTIEIWAKFERGQKQILFDGSTEDGNNTFCLEVVGQQLRFQVSISYEHTLCAQINLAEFPQEFESRFHHLVATWNLADSEKSGKIQLVCDTFYKASDQIAEVEISSQFTTLYFGLARSVKTINYPDDLTNAAPFFGEFSQIRIWDVVRSFTDVLRLQYADLAGDEANLQVYLPIDEGAQATLINLAASNGKEVTIKRIAIPDPNPEWQNVDWAVRLDGDDDFIRLSEENETYEITDEGTIEIWAKFSRDRNQVLFDASNDNSDNSRRQKFFILEVNKRKLRFGLEDQSGRDYVVQIPLKGDEHEDFGSRWHHIAATWKYDPENKNVLVSLYIDGIAKNAVGSPRPDSSKRSSGKGVKPQFGSLIFGKLGSTYYPWGRNPKPRHFSGLISQIRVWDCERSAEDIQDGRDEIITDPDNNLKIYLPIEEGEGLDLENRANEQHHQAIPRAILEVGVGDQNNKWVNIERSIRLNGQEKFIELPDYVPIPSGTIELWTKFSRGDNQILFDASDDSGNVFILEVTNSDLQLRLSDSQGNQIELSIELSGLPDNFDRSWHHVVATWEFDHQNTINVQLFIDGETGQNSSQILNWLALQNLYFGIKRNQADSLENYLAFEGEISQIRIWNYVRTPRDLNHWRYGELNGTETGLLFYLPILEGQGYELSNLAQDKPAFVKTGVFPDPKWVWNQSTLLSFQKDYAVLPKTSELKVQNHSFTIEAWVKLEDFAKEYPILGVRNPRDSNSTESQFQFYVNTDGHVALKMGTYELKVDYQLEPEIWYHVICQYNLPEELLELIIIKRDYREYRYDPETKKLVIGIELGKSLFKDSLSSVKPYKSDRRLYIGYYRIWNKTQNTWQENYFKGHIDEVRFWNYVLTEDQIEDLQDRRLRGDETGLVAYWPISGEYNRTIFSSGSELYQTAIPHQINPISALFTNSQAKIYPKIYTKRPVIELDGYNDYLALGNLCFDDPPVRCLDQNPHTFEFWFKDNEVLDAPWQHIAATYNNSSPDPVEIFLDGVSVPTQPKLIQILNSFYIGSYRPDNPSDCPQVKIAELRFWSKHLNQAEIQDNLNRYLTGREQDLWALWRLNEGLSDQLHDISETLSPAQLVVGLENTLAKWIKEKNLPIKEAVSTLYFDGKDDHILLENSTSANLNLCHPEYNSPRQDLLYLETILWKLNGPSNQWLLLVLYRYSLAYCFTIETWIKIDTSKENQVVLGRFNPDLIRPENPIFSVGIESKKPFISFGVSNKLTADYQIGSNIWHHIAWQYDAFSGKMQILVDGNVVGSELGHVPYSADVPIAIGAGLSEDGSAPKFFNGQISEIRIWNSWRTQDDIQKYDSCRLYGTQEVLNELVAYWIFDDRNRTVIPSRIPHPPTDTDNLYELILESDINDRQLVQPEWQQIVDHPILLNSLPQQAFSFNGDRQYLATNDLEFTSNNFTFETWIKVEKSATNPIIWWGKNDNTNFELRVNDSNRVEFYVEETSALITSNHSITLGNFTHVAFTVQFQDTETRITIYLGGEEQGTNTTSSTFILKDQILQIGRGEVGGNSTYFTGKIQEIRIWDGVRTIEDIQNYLHHSLVDRLNFTELANCIAYWPLNLSEFINQEPYALNYISNRSHLRLGGLPETRQVSSGNPTEFIDPRRKVLTFPLAETILADLSIPDFENQTVPENRMQRTIEVWFLAHEPFSKEKQIIYAEGNSDRGLSIYLEEGLLHFEGFNEPPEESGWEKNEQGKHKISTGRIQANTWHHAALVLDGRAEIHDNAFAAFLDAKPIDTKPGSQIWGKPEEITIGNISFNPDSPDTRTLLNIAFLGQIAYIQVWASARTLAVIKAERFDPKKTDQVFFWNTANTSPPSAISPMFITEQSQREVADSSIDLEDLAFVHELQTRYKQPINRLSVLWDEIKHTGVEDNRTLFDDIFNPSGTQNLNRWSYNQRLIWEVDSSEEFQRQIRSRLMSSLRVSSTDLDLMVQLISGKVSRVIIDGDYLNQLYRLKQMVILFKISVKDLVRLLEILRDEAQDSGVPFNDLASFTLQDLKKVQDRADWLIDTGIDVAEYDYLVLDRLDPRIDIPYTEVEAINTATDLLNQSQEYLVTPNKLVSEEIAELAAIAVYQTLLQTESIREITLQLPAEDNNSFNGVNLGVVQNNFNKLDKRTFLNIIAEQSNWLEAFTGLAISLKNLQRKSYFIFNPQIDYSLELNAGNFPEELRNEFATSKYHLSLSNKISVATETWQILEQATAIPKYAINSQNDIFHVYEIEEENRLFLFDIDSRFDNQLNRQVFPEEFRPIFKHNGIDISESQAIFVNAIEWQISDTQGNILYVIKQELTETNEEFTSTLAVYGYPSTQLLFNLNSDFAKSLSKGVISDLIRQDFTNAGKQLPQLSIASATKWLVTEPDDGEALETNTTQNQERSNREDNPIKLWIQLAANNLYEIVDPESANEDSLFTIDTNFSDQFNQGKISDEFSLIFKQKLDVQLPEDTEIISTEWIIKDLENHNSYTINHYLQESRFAVYGGWLDDLGKIIIREQILFDIEPSVRNIQALEKSLKDEDAQAFRARFDDEKGVKPLSENLNVSTRQWLFNIQSDQYAIAYQSENYCFNIYELEPDLGRFYLFNVELGLVAQLEKGELPQEIRSYLEQKLKLKLPDPDDTIIKPFTVKPDNNQSDRISKQWRIIDKNTQINTVVATIQLKQDGNFCFFKSARINPSSYLGNFDPIVDGKLLNTDSGSKLLQKLQVFLAQENLETPQYIGKEWLIIDSAKYLSYIVRHDKSLNTLEILEGQNPDLLTLTALRSAYGLIQPAADKAKLIEVRELLQSRKLIQETLITTLESNLKNYRTGLNSTIITELAGLLETSEDRLQLILSQTEGKTYDSGKFLTLEFLTQISELFQDQYLDPDSDLNSDLKQISKILVLLKQFTLSEEEVAALLANPIIFNLQPKSLLMTTQADLNWLFTFTKLKEFFPSKADENNEDLGLLNILDNPNRLGEFDPKSVNEFTNWSDADLNTLASQEGLALQMPDNTITIPNLERLRQAFDLTQILRTTPKYLLDLAKIQDLGDFDPIKDRSDPRFSFYERHAEILFNLVRAKYTDEQWERVWKPIHAVLATQQRDSLIAVTIEDLYNSGNILGRKTPDLLYEYLLLDVQTESEVNTSRIVQGTASLQLYIQRCLMSLEKGVNPESIPQQEWLWMKNYRVWEANRKVFLYPENYIEPELRDTKTPIFKQLEEELLQGDVNKESAELAYTHYLDRFAEISNLTIVGSYFDREKNLQSVSALKFNGRSNLPIGTAEGAKDFIPQNFTIELWINPLPNWFNNIISITNSGGDQGWKLQVFSSWGNYVSFELNTKNDEDDIFQKVIYSPISFNRWQHIAVTYDGTKIAIYVDGISRISEEISGEINYPTSGNILLGGSGDFKFVGQMRELRIWDIARSEDEIRKTMLGGIKNPKDEDNLLRYWKMDEEVGKEELENSAEDVSDCDKLYCTLSLNDDNIKLVKTNDTERFKIDEIEDKYRKSTLYLVGRNEATQEYYFRRLINESEWEPWQKIDISINAKFVSPVFAFNKLFLFWSELQESVKTEDRKWANQLNSTETKRDQLGNKIILDNEAQTGGKLLESPNNIPGTTIKQKVFATRNDVIEQINVPQTKPILKYSYYNFSKTWTQPQTYEEFEYLNDWEKFQPKWQRVYAHRWREPNLAPEVKPVILEQNVKVTQLMPDLSKSKSIENADMGNLTFSFWLKIENLRDKSSSSSKPDKHIFTIFEYITNTASELTATLSSEWVRIGEKPEAFIALESANLTFADIQTVISSIKDFRDEPTKANRDQLITNLDLVNPDLNNNLKNTINAIQQLTNSPEEKSFAEKIIAAAQTKQALEKVTPPQENPPYPPLSDADAVVLAQLLKNLAERIFEGAQAIVSTPIPETEIQKIRDAAEAASTTPSDANNQVDLIITAHFPSLLQQIKPIINNFVDNKIEEDKWERGEVELQLTSRALEPVALTSLKYSSWLHIALSFEFNASTSQYKITRYIYDRDASPSQYIEEGVEIDFNVAKFSQGGDIFIGNSNNPPSNLPDGQYKPLISDFRLWSTIRQESEISSNRDQRLTDDTINLLAYFKLDQNQVVASDLDFYTVSDALETKPSNERIIIIYANKLFTLKSNLKDIAYIYDLKENNSAAPFLDIGVNKKNSGRIEAMKIKGFLPERCSIANKGYHSLDRYDPEDRFELLDEDKQPLIPQPKPVKDAEQNWNDPKKVSIILQNNQQSNGEQLDVTKSYILDVHNQPGWKILDIGDEIFLMKINMDDYLLKTTEERLTSEGSEYLGQGQGRKITLYYDRDRILEVGYGLTPKFEFIRLNTFVVQELSENLFGDGIDGLLNFESQESEEPDFGNLADDNLINDGTIIAPKYQPNSLEIDNRLDFEGAYGPYYWEIFFHIPFLIANQLNSNQKFADAQKWYHYIFNPTARGTSDNSSISDFYWQFRPFRNFSLDTLSEMLSNSDALEKYRKDPFDPHAIARLRIMAYQKAIVMKYIDNLLDWGDYLFRQDTRESINEALPLYVLAFNLMGPRPKAKPKREFEDIGSYQDLVEDLKENNVVLPEDFPDFIVQTNGHRNIVNRQPNIPFNPNNSVITRFCVPENQLFLGYWDRVEDRLYKIRHSLNIDGVFRSLDLFQPPINPAALVRAVAGGGLSGGLSAALASINLPVPHYRYSFMVEKAKEMLRQAIELGGALLQALEKKDAEELTLLLNTHQLNLLNRTTEVKELQKVQAEANLKSLEVSLESAKERQRHYQDLISRGISKNEISNMSYLGQASDERNEATQIRAQASFLRTFPDLQIGGAGAFGSPYLTASIGGSLLGTVVDIVASSKEVEADITSTRAQITGILAGFERRAEDWELQEKLASYEISQIERQIEASAAQINITTREIQIHEQTITQQKELGDFYRSKFNNKDLYNWMSNRLSGLYFQTYKLAFDLAKQAERAFQFEYGTNENFINFGHWDSRRKGLLAGETLRLDLARLEKASLDRHKRYLEITKHVSLIRHDPFALLQLKETGRCQFNLDELLFDRDFPGHYFRVIKSISISIPAIIGPYQTFKATLTQTGHKTLLQPDLAGVKYLLGEEQEVPTSVRADFRANQQIAISTGVEDSGMFELNFSDGRYLPFEGTGAVSSWLLEMPKATNAIDFSTITDIIIHVRYACKSDGGKFKQDVMELETFKNYQGMRLISMVHEFPNEWHSYKNSNDSQINIPITSNLFPPNVVFDSNIDNFELQQALSINENDVYSEANVNFGGINNDKLTVEPIRLKKEEVRDLILLVSYTGTM